MEIDSGTNSSAAHLLSKMTSRYSTISLILLLVSGCSPSPITPAEDFPQRRAYSQWGKDKVKRRISLDIENATFELASSKVFDALDLRNVLIRDQHPELGPSSVSLKFQGASLWEALDLLSKAAGERYDVAFPMPQDEYPEPGWFKFLRPFMCSDTIGDVRVFSAADVWSSQVHVRFYAAFAPWAVPKNARIVDIRIAGYPTQRDERIIEFGARKGDLPNKEGCITAIKVPYA